MIEVERTIRAARLTDRQALTDLSRRVHAASDAHRRSLGVPAPTTESPRISLSTLIPSWLPLRAPSVHLVAEVDGEIVGSCRAIEEPHRDDWVITELDAADGPMAAEIRYDLLGALVEEGARHEVARFHAACADVRENLELFGQSSFMAYAQEEIWWRAPEPARGPRSWLRSIVSRDGTERRPDDEPELRPAGAPDAWHLFDLWSHATPPAIARIEGYGAADWESVGNEGIVPRSALNPILHFSQVDCLAHARGAACRRLRPARRLPLGPALPALPDSRRHRRRAIPARGARTHGRRRDRCRHPRSGANIRVGGHARCRGRRLRTDRTRDVARARGARTGPPAGDGPGHPVTTT